ncbi:hypothetical protein MTO96_051828, partial [Rhipicephalus appendiculatus]
ILQYVQLHQLAERRQQYKLTRDLVRLRKSKPAQPRKERHKYPNEATRGHGIDRTTFREKRKHQCRGPQQKTPRTVCRSERGVQWKAWGSASCEGVFIPTQ